MTDEGDCFVLTIHPFLSGRPSRAQAPDRLLAHIEETPGVWITRADELAEFVAGLELPPVRHEPPLTSGPSLDVRTAGRFHRGSA